MIEVKVKREYENIDIYLTDGKKHLIIENKIWTLDQPYQVMRYVNKIVNLNKESFQGIEKEKKLDEDKIIRVLYLTLRKKPIPSGHKLCENGKYICVSEECPQEELKNYKVWFKKISYKKEILDWINWSINNIDDKSNLQILLEQYKQL